MITLLTGFAKAFLEGCNAGFAHLGSNRKTAGRSDCIHRHAQALCRQIQHGDILPGDSYSGHRHISVDLSLRSVSSAQGERAWDSDSPLSLHQNLRNGKLWSVWNDVRIIVQDLDDCTWWSVQKNELCSASPSSAPKGAALVHMTDQSYLILVSSQLPPHGIHCIASQE